MRTNQSRGGGKRSGSARVDQHREDFYAQQLASMREILTPEERELAHCARHKCLFIQDVAKVGGAIVLGAATVYLSIHPTTPEEGLSGAERRIERDAFNRDLEELAEFLAENDDYADLPQASEPSPAEPGTDARMYDYYLRYVAGRNLFHPNDSQRDPCDRVGAGVSRGPNGRAQREELRLVTDDDEDVDDEAAAEELLTLERLRATAAAALKRVQNKEGGAA